MGKSEPPTVEIDAEKSLIKMTPVRLVAIIAAVVLVTNVAGNRISALVTQAQMEARFAAHEKHPHDPASARLAQVEAKDAEQDAQLAKLEDVPRQVAAVRAKMDTLLIRELEKSEPSRNAVERAAAKVRARREIPAGSAQDPLDGLE